MRALVFLIAVGACAPAEMREATTEGEVWGSYVAALDGERLRALRSWTAVANYDYRAGELHAEVEATTHWRQPGDYYQSMAGPAGPIERGLSGNDGWGRHPQTGQRTMDEQEILEARRDAAFYQPYLFAGDYESLTEVGRDTAGGRPVDVVAGVVRINGRTERLMFDAQTHLPVRLELWEGGPEGQREPGEYVQVRFDLGDYRNVDGIMLPHHIVRRRPNSTITYAIKSLRLNVPVPDSLFKTR